MIAKSLGKLFWPEIEILNLLRMRDKNMAKVIKSECCIIELYLFLQTFKVAIQSSDV